MTAAIPTIQVLLDDGTGAYATDITSRVSLSSITVSGHGRTDEFSTASATSFSCTLKNDDGGLSTGLGFGLGPFGLGGFGGSGSSFGTIYPGQGIRYRETKGATSVDVFTGRFSELPLGWTGGPAKSSQVHLMAVDPLSALALRPLRSMIEEEILLASPAAYYTLGEGENSTTAGDTSGNQATPLTITTAGGGGVMTFGVGVGPGSDGLTAAVFPGISGGLSGQYLTDGNNVTAQSPTTFTVSCWFNTTTTPPLAANLAQSAGWSLSIDNTGHLTASGPGFSGLTYSSATVTDGVTHHVAVAGGGIGTVALYVDGVVRAVGTVGTATANQATNVGLGFTGTLSHVAFGPTSFSGTRLFNIYSAAAGITETTAARFARIASYAGFGASLVSTPSNSGLMMGAQSTSGSTALDALQSVAAAEGGVMFANGHGTLVLQGRGYRAAKTTATLTVPMKDILASTVSLTWDTQQLLNQVTVTRAGGAAQVVADANSIATYGTYATSLDLGLAADADALSAAQWLVNKHLAPVQRMPSVTVNLLTSAIPDQILATEIGDRWALSGMPSQAWPGFGDLTVEGWSKTLSVTESGAEWSMTVNLLPFSLSQAAVYDDANSTYDSAVYA